MVAMETYEFARGATIVLRVEDDGADPADIAKISSSMALLEPGADEPAFDAETFDFDVTYRAASADLAKGWDFTMSSIGSADLVTGHYLADYVITDGISVEVSSPVKVIIKESATL